MKMQKAPLAERLSERRSYEKTKCNTLIVSDLDNEVQAFWQSVKTLVSATFLEVVA